jgi:hypothetical protein
MTAEKNTILDRLRTTNEIREHKFTPSELALNEIATGPCGLFAAALITGADVNLISRFKNANGTNWRELARILAVHNLMIVPVGSIIEKNRLYVVSDSNHMIVVDTRNDDFFARDSTQTYDKQYFEQHAIAAYEILHYDNEINSEKSIVDSYSSFDKCYELAEKIIDLQSSLANARRSNAAFFFVGIATAIIASILIK